jgi:hypothetical protein
VTLRETERVFAAFDLLGDLPVKEVLLGQIYE